METKSMVMILGVALLVATAATLYTQSASAIVVTNHGNGVTGGDHTNNGKHLGQGPSPTGGASIAVVPPIPPAFA